MSDIKIVLEDDHRAGARKCGDCQLCCKLLPVNEGVLVDGARQAGAFHKPAGQRCPHQRFKRGCGVYNTRRMPHSCKLWNCRWLVNDDTADLSRPDHSHVVLDLMPDFVTASDNETGEQWQIEVVQVWVDPRYPDAWRHPSLMAYFERRGREGKAALIRYSSSEGFTLFPPSISNDGQWHEVRGEVRPQRTPEEFLRLARGGE